MRLMAFLAPKPFGLAPPIVGSVRPRVPAVYSCVSPVPAVERDRSNCRPGSVGRNASGKRSGRLTQHARQKELRHDRTENMPEMSRAGRAEPSTRRPDSRCVRRKHARVAPKLQDDARDFLSDASRAGTTRRRVVQSCLRRAPAQDFALKVRRVEAQIDGRGRRDGRRPKSAAASVGARPVRSAPRET